MMILRPARLVQAEEPARPEKTSNSARTDNDRNEEGEAIRKVDEMLRQVVDLIRDDLIDAAKARELRGNAIKQLRETTTNVKETIKLLRTFCDSGLLPEDEFKEAKDLIADAITDPEYQKRSYANPAILREDLSPVILLLTSRAISNWHIIFTIFDQLFPP